MTTTRPHTVMEDALAAAGVFAPEAASAMEDHDENERYVATAKRQQEAGKVRRGGATVLMERGPFVPLTVPADHPTDPASPARCELRDRAAWYADEFQQDGRGRLGQVVHEDICPWHHRVDFLFASGARLSLTMVPHGPKGTPNDRLFWPADHHAAYIALLKAPPEARRAVEDWLHGERVEEREEERNDDQ